MTDAYGIVSAAGGDGSVTRSFHFENVVVPPPEVPVITSLTGRMSEPDEMVKTLFVAGAVCVAAVFQVSW